MTLLAAILSRSETASLVLLVLIAVVVLSWEAHRKAVNEAYRRGRQDGSEWGPEPLMRHALGAAAEREEELWHIQHHEKARP
jgi:hypothetical protein